MAKSKETLKAKDAESSVGYGYSDILTQLLTSLDRPITNSDEYRTYYKEMLSNDETISTGIEYLTGRIVSRIGSYSHEDEKIKELVDRSIESIRGTMTEVRRSILRDSFAYGFGAGEFSVNKAGSQWLLSSVQILNPSSVQFQMTQHEDKSYSIGYVVQKAGMNEVKIPAEKCLIRTYGDNSTPYGKSLLRKCYRWWSLKKAIPKLWAVCLERFGTPILHGKSKDRDTRKQITEALMNLNSRSYITTDEESVIQAIFTPSGAISSNYVQALEICDKMIYRAMFLPSLLGSGENGGSYSLGQVHFELFNATCSALAADYVDAELEQLWRPIIEWNYGEQESYGDFLINDEVTSSEKLTLSNIFLNLSNAGILSPESDREWIRDMLGLPKGEEGAVYPNWGMNDDNNENTSEKQRNVQGEN